MKVIGITGGVGSGKSTVLNKIKELYNCEVLYADDAAKELELPGHKCYEELISLLGEDILDAEGLIDAKKMAAKIYADGTLLEKVNAIIHPAVKIYIMDEIDRARNERRCDYFFLEAALLIECGYLDVVDQMWYIFAREDVRRARLKESRGYSDEKIDSIMKSQLSEEEFRKSCHVVIDNSGDIELTMSQISKVTKDL